MPQANLFDATKFARFGMFSVQVKEQDIVEKMPFTEVALSLLAVGYAAGKLRARRDSREKTQPLLGHDY